MPNSINQLRYLLNSVRTIVNKEKHDKAAKKKRGEDFNVFDILGLKYNETKLHSAFIAELLNPNGSHGLRTEPLQRFLELIDCKEELDLVSAKIMKEHGIGNISEDKKNGGRIDLYIDVDGYGIIIENKIYAGDQEKQMLRYDNYAKDKYRKGYRLIYLTLYGTEPCDNAIGDDCALRKSIICLSYRDHIIDWLEACMQLSIKMPLVRETIAQYIDTLKELTNQDMEEENQKELLDLLTQSDYVESVAHIINNHGGWQATILDKYFEDSMKKVAKELELEFCFYDDLEDLKQANVDEYGFYFRKPDWKYYGIFFMTEIKYWKKFFWGISWYEKPPRNLKIKKQQSMDCLPGESDDCCPYGSEWLDDYYRNWDTRTIVAIATGKFAKYIKGKLEVILAEMKEKGIELY